MLQVPIASLITSFPRRWPRYCLLTRGNGHCGPQGFNGALTEGSGLMCQSALPAWELLRTSLLALGSAKWASGNEWQELRAVLALILVIIFMVI